MTENLDIQLTVEITDDREPIFFATVPRFRLQSSALAFRVLGSGPTPAAALRDFYQRLFDVVMHVEPEVETIKAPSLQRVDRVPEMLEEPEP